MRAPLNTGYRGNANVTELLDRCRELRRDATDAEQLLWRLLRARQVDGLKFRRQHQFGRYVLDFFCIDANLGIELDGGQHFAADTVEYDAGRDSELTRAGIRLLRFTNTEVLQEIESVLEAIWLAVKEPSPLPSPRGRGSRE